MADILLGLVDAQTFFLFVVIVSLAYYLFCSTAHELPPGPKAWPVIGNLLDIGKYGGTGNVCAYYSELQKKYGNVYKIYFGRHLMVVVNGLEALQDVIVKQGGLCSQRPVWLYEPSLTTKNGRGLIWNNDDEWKQLRQITARTFNGQDGQGIGHSTLEDRVLAEVTCLSDVFAHLDGELIRVRGHLDRALANIIYSIVFGSRFDYKDSTFNRLFDATNKIFRGPAAVTAISALPVLRFLPSAMKLRKQYFAGAAVLAEFTKYQLDEHRESFKDTEERDYVDVFFKQQLEHPESTVYTAGNLTRCVMDILSGGVTTTAATLDFGLLYMIKYPDVQHKCQKEIAKFVGHKRQVIISDASALVYTEATLIEIQRMSAVAAFATLHTCPVDVWIGGYRVPRDSLIHLNLASVMHDPDLWGDPHIFRPERYVSLQRELIFPEPWLAFGGGPRSCPGEMLVRIELFLVFANLLQRFHFTKADNSEPDVGPVSGMTTVNPKPYQVLIESIF